MNQALPVAVATDFAAQRSLPWASGREAKGVGSFGEILAEARRRIVTGRAEGRSDPDRAGEKRLRAAAEESQDGVPLDELSSETQPVPHAAASAPIDAPQHPPPGSAAQAGLPPAAISGVEAINAAASLPQVLIGKPTAGSGGQARLEPAGAAPEGDTGGLRAAHAAQPAGTAPAGSLEAAAWALHSRSASWARNGLETGSGAAWASASGTLRLEGGTPAVSRPQGPSEPILPFAGQGLEGTGQPDAPSAQPARTGAPFQERGAAALRAAAEPYGSDGRLAGSVLQAPGSVSGEGVIWAGGRLREAWLQDALTGASRLVSAQGAGEGTLAAVDPGEAFSAPGDGRPDETGSLRPAPSEGGASSMPQGLSADTAAAGGEVRDLSAGDVPQGAGAEGIHRGESEAELEQAAGQAERRAASADRAEAGDRAPAREAGQPERAAREAGPEAKLSNVPAPETSPETPVSRGEAREPLFLEARRFESAARGALEQMVRRVEGEVQGDNASLKFHLAPGRLGDLELNIEVERGVLVAKFIAASEEVRTLIESALPDLRRSLAQQGIEVGELSVSVGQSGDQGRPEGEPAHEPAALQLPSARALRASAYRGADGEPRVSFASLGAGSIDVLV